MYDDINTPYESIVSLGEAFAKYRKSLKISQQRLHEMTGISISLSHFLLMDAVGLDMSLSGLIPVVSDIDPEKLWMSQNKKGGRE